MGLEPATHGPQKRRLAHSRRGRQAASSSQRKFRDDRIAILLVMHLVLFRIGIVVRNALPDLSIFREGSVAGGYGCALQRGRRGGG